MNWLCIFSLNYSLVFFLRFSFALLTVCSCCSRLIGVNLSFLFAIVFNFIFIEWFFIFQTNSITFGHNFVIFIDLDPQGGQGGQGGGGWQNPSYPSGGAGGFAPPPSKYHRFYS